jgi:hypothetical protein
LVKTINEEQPNARARAELRALNIPVDWEKSADIELQSDEIDIFGASVGASDDSVGNISKSETVDPSNFPDTSFYINCNVQETRADWTSKYDDTKGIDGGELHLTELPGAAVEKWIGSSQEIQVLTNYDETASFTPDQTTQKTVNGNDVYEIDLSDQLDNSIAEVVEMWVYAASSADNRYQTRIPDQPFYITDIEGGATIRFERDRELQTDDNYTTSDEWDKIQEALREEQEAIEESSGVGGVGWPDIDIPTIPGLGVIESAVVVILAIFGLNAASG